MANEIVTFMSYGRKLRLWGTLNKMISLLFVKPFPSLIKDFSLQSKADTVLLKASVAISLKT